MNNDHRLSQRFSRPFLSVACFLFVLGSGAHSLEAEQSDAAKPRDDQTVVFKKQVKPLLSKYCFKCHGEQIQKGERRFDELVSTIENDDTFVDMQDILDQLNLGQMPPQDEQQPTATERRQIIDWMTQNIASYHDSRRASKGETVLRRLNSREYRNTVRDLFGINMLMFDPTVEFPLDQTTEHLDNVGETLVTSGYLLQQYLAAADVVVEKVMSPRQQPEVQSWEFRNGFRQQPEIDQVFRKVNNFDWMTLFDVIGADKHEGAYGPIHAFSQGVPHDGFYELRIKAEAVNREHPYDPEFLGTDPTEPLRLGIVAGNQEAGPLHKPQPIEPLLAELELADEQKWYTVRVWLDQGYTPRFTFQNGLMDARNLWSRLLKKYPDQFPKRKNSGIVEARFNAIKYGRLPQIRIHEIEIKGPFYNEWPTAGQQSLLGEDWETAAKNDQLSDALAQKHLKQFAERAYRRPVSEAEIDRVMQVVLQRRKSGRTALESYGDGIKMILCSPGFLYIDEPVSEVLSPFQLASRLSYFLWSSMPDAELIELANSGKLQDPEVLESQIERMLDDSKSAAFVDGLLESWLTLRDFGSTPPDRNQFRTYYHYDLGKAMREETRLFTRYLLDKNLSIQHFLDSDFTFANSALARHYNLPSLQGAGFQQVALKDPRRGGLLGQGSVLTVTANGIDTSPVVRGVWMLENMLGTPPSPPPPDVEPLDPDIRGAKTIRDQLKKHRSVASCNDCHRKIDPLGFALENFDPVGRWRMHYPNKTEIDVAGELPDGTKFKNIVDLKEILVQHDEQFTRALTSKILAYGLGRTIEPTDRSDVDQIVAALNEKGDGFSDLVKLVAMSELFRSK